MFRTFGEAWVARFEDVHPLGDLAFFFARVSEEGLEVRTRGFTLSCFFLFAPFYVDDNSIIVFLWFIKTFLYV